MKAIVKINDKISVECTSDTDDGLFKGIAEAQNNEGVFGDYKCGVCGSTDIKYVVREAEGFEFFEQHCCKLSCRARLSFGKAKGLKMYPKRCETEKTGKNKGHAIKGPDGKAIVLPNRGWKVYNPEEKNG